MVLYPMCAYKNWWYHTDIKGAMQVYEALEALLLTSYIIRHKSCFDHVMHLIGLVCLKATKYPKCYIHELLFHTYSVNYWQWKF